MGLRRPNIGLSYRTKEKDSWEFKVGVVNSEIQWSNHEPLCKKYEDVKRIAKPMQSADRGI